MDCIQGLKRKHEREEALARVEASKNIITCYETWNLERLEHIKTKLQLPIEMKRTLDDIHIEPGVPRFRVNYSTGKGDTRGRVYGKIVYHSERYKKRKIEKEGAYIYESSLHDREEDTEGGSSLQSLCGWIRRQIAHEYYRDYDISNCAPTLLQQILQRVNLCPGELIAYNEQRDTLFRKYASVAPSGEVKKAFLVVLHMGSGDARFPETFRLRESLRACLLKLASLTDDHISLYKRCEVACELKCLKKKHQYMANNAYAKVTKTLGKFCAIIWNREEHRVLMRMRDYFVNEEGYDGRHMVLCFDGLMVEKKRPIEQPVNLEALAHYVEKHTGFCVRVEEKSMMPTEKDMALYNGELIMQYKEKKKYY